MKAKKQFMIVKIVGAVPIKVNVSKVTCKTPSEERTKKFKISKKFSLQRKEDFKKIVKEEDLKALSNISDKPHVNELN